MLTHLSLRTSTQVPLSSSQLQKVLQNGQPLLDLLTVHLTTFQDDTPPGPLSLCPTDIFLPTLPSCHGPSLLPLSTSVLQESTYHLLPTIFLLCNSHPFHTISFLSQQHLLCSHYVPDSGPCAGDPLLDKIEMVSVSQSVESTGKMAITVSPLHTNLQAVDFQRGKRVCMFACPIIEVSWHVWHPLSHVCAYSTSNCAFVYCTVYRSTVSLFQDKMPRNKRKSSSDGAATALPGHPWVVLLRQ